MSLFIDDFIHTNFNFHSLGVVLVVMDRDHSMKQTCVVRYMMRVMREFLEDGSDATPN